MYYGLSQMAGIRSADLVLDDIPVQLDLFGNQEKKEKLEKSSIGMTNMQRWISFGLSAKISVTWEMEKMVTRLKIIEQKAVENHVNGAVWAFDYDKMFCVLMENEICRKVCEKNKYNSWMKLIGQYCISMA